MTTAETETYSLWRAWSLNRPARPKFKSKRVGRLASIRYFARILAAAGERGKR